MNILSLLNLLLAGTVGVVVFLNFRSRMKKESRDKSVRKKREKYEEIFGQSF